MNNTLHNPNHLDIRGLISLPKHYLILEHSVKFGLITVYEILDGCKAEVNDRLYFKGGCIIGRIRMNEYILKIAVSEVWHDYAMLERVCDADNK